MKRYYLLIACAIFSLFILVIGIVASTSARPVQAADPLNPDVPRGATLYDKWYTVLNKPAPAGNSPIWSRQTTNTRSGPDTWRCVECHGWDYKGKDGAYATGNHATGFPGVWDAVQTLSQADIVAVLKGSKDPAHNYAPYMDDASLNQLAVFLKMALVDDNQYIDPVTLKIKGGNLGHGKTLFTQNCGICHAADGTKIAISFDGTTVSFGKISASDPWRFLHKTRFGTPGTQATIGYNLGWSAQDGRDVLLYAQTLAGGNQRDLQPSVIGEGQITPEPLRGGPPPGIFGGIATALAMIATGLGFNILVAAVLISILLLVVWALRARK